MNSRSERAPRASGLRIPLVLVPFAVYLGVTVLEPAMHGAAGRVGFWEHTAITLAVSGVMMVGWLAVRVPGRLVLRAALRRRSSPVASDPASRAGTPPSPRASRR